MSEPAPGSGRGQNTGPSAHGVSCRTPGCPYVPSTANEGRPALEAREQILDVAACLFVGQGFAATSTREIAEAAGIREALIRHHFSAGKGEILAELLHRLIQPRLDNIERIEDLRAATGAGSEVLLFALVVLDVSALARAPHNIGALARQAEALHQDVGAPFRAAQDELLATYMRLAGQVSDATRSTVSVAPTDYFLGTMVLQQVEGVIEMRSLGDRITSAREAAVAASCLRICLADQTRIDEAAAQAADLIGTLE